MIISAMKKTSEEQCHKRHHDDGDYGLSDWQNRGTQALDSAYRFHAWRIGVNRLEAWGRIWINIGIRSDCRCHIGACATTALMPGAS